MKASGIRVEHLADDRDYYKGVVAYSSSAKKPPKSLTETTIRARRETPFDSLADGRTSDFRDRRAAASRFRG